MRIFRAAVLLTAAAALLVSTSPRATAADKPAAPPKKPDPAMIEVPDEPGLPRVMLIGDSISVGYTIPVRELLKGKANVHRPLTNSGDTKRGIDQLDKWLGDGKWDVIHFNFGLHDLKYVDEKGQMVPVEKGKQNISVEQYEKNLRQIVERLKKTGAKLIWCSTTPVPEGNSGRVPGDEVKYNQAALKVMQEAGVTVNDLWAAANKELSRIQKPKNVHYTDEGSKYLAEVVVAQIEAALKK